MKKAIWTTYTVFNIDLESINIMDTPMNIQDAAEWLLDFYKTLNALVSVDRYSSRSIQY